MRVACPGLRAAGRGHGSKMCKPVKYNAPPPKISATKEEAEAYCKNLGGSWAVFDCDGLVSCQQAFGMDDAPDGVVFCTSRVDSLGRPTRKDGDNITRPTWLDANVGYNPVPVGCDVFKMIVYKDGADIDLMGWGRAGRWYGDLEEVRGG